MVFEITLSHGGAMINFWPSNRTGSTFEIDKFCGLRCSFQLRCSVLRGVSLLCSAAIDCVIYG